MTRRNPENQPPGGWHPEQRMTREEALASMTRWAAYAGFQEEVMGSLAPGKYADFVVLDRDIMTAPAESILATCVVETYVGGVVDRPFAGRHGRDAVGAARPLYRELAVLRGRSHQDTRAPCRRPADALCLSDTRQMFLALKRLGLTAEYVEYPRGGHLPVDWVAEHKRDIANRMIGWFECYLKGTVGPEPVTTSGN